MLVRGIILASICINAFFSNDLFGVQRVHCFGDSNVIFNFTEKPLLENPTTSASWEQIHNYEGVCIPFIINMFMAKTMYGVSKEGFLDIRSYDVKDDEIVVFVFGCVDVYFHIANQRDLNHRDLDEILDSLVFNYLKCILDNRANYKNLFCVVTSILPPFRGIPGDLNDKIHITQRLNAKLQLACLENDVFFLDIHDIYRVDSGSLNYELSDRTHHVGMQYNYPIRKKLFDIIYSNNFMNTQN